MKKILLFGGTTEGHQLACWLHSQQIPFLVCVATDYGSALLPEGLPTHVGRLTQTEMEHLIAAEHCDLVIDATHPYAVEVTQNLRAASEAAGRPCLRLLRQSDGEDACHKAGDMATAAHMLQSLPGNVLLTTGSKELHHFAVPGLIDRCCPRVLPMLDSLQRCLSLGFPPAHILCMQGPFSRELNAAILRQYDIKTLVTKDTGTYGGFRAKADAAKDAGCALLVVERPTQEEGLVPDEIQDYIKRWIHR